MRILNRKTFFKAWPALLGAGCSIPFAGFLYVWPPKGAIGFFAGVFMVVFIKALWPSFADCKIFCTDKR